MKNWFVIAILLVGIIGCQRSPEETAAAVEPVPSYESAVGISRESLARHIDMLASDEFEGRAPGSVGEERTVEYLTQEFRSLGLAPGNPDGTFVQMVPLVGLTPSDGMSLIVRGDDTERVFEPGKDYVAFTKRVVEDVILDGELVFVGYGVVAPEYGWDDFKDQDVRGKVIVTLVNDPPGDDIFGGEAMTYYGRWTYKHEIAAQRGAAGVFVIHETGPAGYPWEVIGGTPYVEQFDLVTEDNRMGRAQVEGWIQRATAEALFEMAGLDFEEAKRAAAGSDFRPVALGLDAHTDFRNTIRRVDSKNVVARLEGGEAADEVVMYVAHWDHLGKDETLTGDQIFNGALDNATGTAALLGLAEAFGRLESPPRRSVAFLAVTAEEQGLLGSMHYARSPLYPAEKTAAVINMDGINIWGRTRDVTVVGLGQSSLDDLAAEFAAAQNRILRPDPEPEKGYYYRSDHFELAKIGIPALYPDGGVDFLGRPEGWGIETRAKYIDENYHKVSDEVKDWWDLSGAVEDLDLYFQIGHRIASGTDWPQWSESSEFRR